MLKNTFIKEESKQIPNTLKCIIIFFSIMLSVTILLFISQDLPSYVFKIELLVVGWFIWTFMEYMLHRFVYHEKIHKHPSNLQQLHNYHHSHPTEIRVKTADRFILIIISILSLWMPFWLHTYFFLVSGFLCGIAIFSIMHYVIHQTWSATLFPRLHRYHIYHHCRYPNHCYGISVTWWDIILHTNPPVEKKITDKIKSFYYGEITRKA